MNDTIIINTISKIHFILITLFSFAFIFFVTLFILLQHGIYLDEISFQNVKVKQLYIKWDEKIRLNAQEISVGKNKKEHSGAKEYEKILQMLKTTLPYAPWIQEVHIEKILYGNFYADLLYRDNKQGYFHLYGPKVKLSSTIRPDKELLHFIIKELQTEKKSIAAHGDLVLFPLNKRLSFVAALNITVDKKNTLELFMQGDTQKLSYSIEANKKIEKIKKIISLFDLDPKIKYWVDDAIDTSGLSLEMFYGWLEYKNIKKAYLNLHAKATAHTLRYSYDTKLAPVSSSKTKLEFKEGVLYIRPQNAYSYGFFLDKSRLKIDFSKKHELLTLHLLFQAQADKNLLFLLQRYGIKLPFIQTKGRVDTDLKLDIDLRTLDVKALGRFYTKKAQIRYLDLDIDLFNAEVFVKNTHVSVRNMLAKYKKTAVATTDLTYDAKKSKGKLELAFDTIQSKKHGISLYQNGKPFRATYIITPEQDYIAIEKSIWKYNKRMIYLDSTKLAVDMKRLKANLPKTAIKFSDIGTGFLSADLTFQPIKANVTLDITRLHHKDISLSKELPSLDIHYKDKNLSIRSKKPLKFKIKDQELSFSNPVLTFHNGILETNDTRFSIKNILRANVSASYDTKTNEGDLALHSMQFLKSNLQTFFQTQKEINFRVKKRGESLLIRSDTYDLEYFSNKKEHQLHFNSLEKVASFSKFLRKYALKEGTLSLKKLKDQKKVHFSLNTAYPYKFLVIDDAPVKNYALNGTFDMDTKKTECTINTIVQLRINHDIQIQTDKVGIHLKEILNFFDTFKIENKNSKHTNVYFNATNSYVYLDKNRRMISDTIHLSYRNKALFIELKHAKAKALFTLKEHKMHFSGKKFNDTFMNELFALSKFKKGTLEFYINGSPQKYEGVVHVKNTTILDYKILNNILAFVNTVPSLVTFSLPGYNKNGVKTKEAYVNFTFENDIYNMNNIYLKSKEIEIAGIGKASLKQNSIDLDLNLKTDLGSSVSKIPLIGHIIFGEDSISTTLKVTGALDNPDVTTQIAKDIAVAPFNIIKRTLMFPFKLFEKEKKKEN